MSGIYHLSQNELKALITGAGHSCAVGLSLSEAPLTAEQAVQGLNSLMKSNLLRRTDDGFEMTDDLRLIVKAVTGERYVLLHSSRMELPEKALYPVRPVASCTLRGYENAALSFEVSELSALVLSLCDEGYLPEQDSDIPLERLEALSDELDGFERRYAVESGKPLPTASCVLFAADLHDRSGKTLAYLRVMEYGLYRYLLYSADGKTIRKPFSLSAAGSYFEELLKQ